MGNVDEAEARKYAAVIRPRLALERALIPRLQSLIMPVGHRIYSRRNSNPVDKNSVARICSQVGPTSNITLATLTELTSDIYHQNAYDQLRTREQLGYIVWSFTTEANDYFWICTMVVSPSRSAAYLTDRILAFLRNYKTRVLDHMTQGVFAGHTKGYINNLMQKPLSMGNEVARYSAEIDSRTYMFDRRERKRSIALGITLRDIQAFYSRYVIGSKARVLNIQVIGSVHSGSTPRNSTWTNIPSIMNFRTRQRFFDQP